MFARNSEEMSAQGAADMEAAFAPVRARPEQLTTALHKSIQVHAKFGDCVGALVQEIEAAVGPLDEFKPFQRFGEFDAESPGQVIVAPSRKSNIAAFCAPRSMVWLGVGGQCLQRFKCVCDLRASECEIPVPSMCLAPQHPGLDELRQMAAGGIGGDARNLRQFGCRQHAVVLESGEHVGTGGIAHKRGDLSDMRNVGHNSVITESSRRGIRYPAVQLIPLPAEFETMLERDLEPLTRLLRTEISAVHQQFFHMLTLRKLRNDDVLSHVTKIDTEDFKNAMQIIDLLVSSGFPVRLGSDRFFPGSDIPSILRAELRMEGRFAALLSEIEVVGPEAQARVRRAAAPRRQYRDWLERNVDVSEPEDQTGETGEELARFLAHLIALIEQPMLHAFLHWRLDNRAAADNAWRLSGAAMLYAAALVRRGTQSETVLTPGPIPATRMAETPSEAFHNDLELVKRCASLGRDAAGAGPNEVVAWLCNRVADDCDLIAGMEMNRDFPAEFGRSPVFESFEATRAKHLS